MQQLDEDLLNKITYTPECQATFRQYKGKLTEEVLTLLIPAILIGLILLGIGLVMRSDLAFFMLIIVPLGVALSMLFLTGLPNAIKDLKAKKLNIETDTFLKLHMTVDKKAAAKYEGEFQHAGKINVPADRITSIQSNTKVYIIKAAHTGFVIDIVPIDKVKNKL